MSASPTFLDGWRWCRSKDAPEVWEDGNGCLWCFNDVAEDHLLLVTKPADDRLAAS